ncbi:MAG: cobalamin biosynthesis protein [Paracoccus sp. (in: a-proteobacteria)]|uniref:cobalamin biosynthesis protein n=1 Tax=Paracoccus sp. TaxID=267 RepID=UPI0026E10EEB|nr:cobalamin biosynthesis protein [Paracoccus sp. (in: a-proteobacteria)]MDO5631833.1 cobalamin biosynthesis protein [Paracoccus sp. (in: a-proteobacteria)]
MIVAGFGFTSAADAASLRGALGAAIAASGLTPTHAATVADKAAVLAALGLPVIAVTDLPADTPTQSPASLRARATGSVAEATALAAAGPGARLVAPRVISPDRRATCAIARKDSP